MKPLIPVTIISLLLTGCANIPNVQSVSSIVKAVNSATTSIDTALDSSALQSKKQKKQKKHSKQRWDDSKQNHRKSKIKSGDSVAVLKKAVNLGLNGHSDIVSAVGVGVAAVATLAIIGGELAHYFTQQDKENATQVLKETKKTKSVAWCSNSKAISENVDSVECADTHKIIQTPGVATKTEGKLCRLLKTEVVTASGEIETETQNLCQAENGEWYDAKSA